MLIGRYPFHHQNLFAMFLKIACGQFQTPPSINLSIHAKNLLKSLIRVKPNERLLSSEILNHVWLKSDDAEFRSSLQQSPAYHLNANHSRRTLEENDSLAELNQPKKLKLNDMLKTDCKSEDDRKVPSKN